MQFPNVDPIPIPAPVWLMKALSLLTLALHFFAVQILIGSLVAVIIFSLRAKGASKDANQVAALVLSRRLPVVMTYVINLGVPPLLFAQVLYGRALYTSSVLIAVQWIAVIFLLMGCYWLLYRMSEAASAGKPCHFYAIGALLLAAMVGHIYAVNMTLMLKPEVWRDMYVHTATGLQTFHDKTTEPRLLFVLLGGLLVGGFWLTLHSRSQTIEAGASEALGKLGATFAVLGALGELATGVWAYTSQPAEVLNGMHSTYYLVAQGVWALGFVLALLVALFQVAKKAYGTLITIIGALGAFLGIAGAVMVRDGIRDVTLMGKGFDVWKRTEYSNWFVIVLFLLLFVAGLAAITWLLLVMKGAKAIPEQVNS